MQATAVAFRPSSLRMAAMAIRRMRTSVAVLVAGSLFGFPHPGWAQGQPRAEQARRMGCDFPLVATGRAKSVIDGRTLRLDDGREIRLAAIEVAEVLPAEADAERARAGRAAQAALAELSLGRDLLFRQAAPLDRWGRIVAYGYAKQGEGEQSLQRELLARGHARLAARVEEAACLEPWRAAERAARRAALGLWGDPHYSVQAAETPAAIAMRRGRFTVVEGEVVSVRETGGTIYVNFGRRWSESFTAIILKRNAAALAAAGLDPTRFAGRRVEVRGFVEMRGGPRIEVTRPEQIAVASGR